MGRTEKSQGLAPPAVRKDMRAKQARHIVNKVIPGILASNARARRGAEGSELVVNPGVGYVSTERAKEKDIDNKKGTSRRVNGEEAKYVKRKGQGRRRAKGDEGGDGGAESDNDPDDKFSKGKATPKADAEAANPRRDELSAVNNDTGSNTSYPTIRLLPTDALTAARSLLPASKNARSPNPCILNMASPLRPGAGVLAGATSPEEALCSRTTLLPSLREDFYRLPERGGIFTRDVLVFRDARALDDPAGELSVRERWYVDVVSAGMLRFPELEGQDEEGRGGRLSARDRRLVEDKMRAVLRIALGYGARKLVLGAWGCGAYGCPVVDIAQAWRAVLIPSPSSLAHSKTKARHPETWLGLEDVVLAIQNRKMAEAFAATFGVVVEGGEESGDEVEEVDTLAEELRGKIAEMEEQIGVVWNAELKARMGVILDGLRAQLRDRESVRVQSGWGESEDSGGEDGDMRHSLQQLSPFSEDEDADEDTDVDVDVVHYSSDEWQVSPFD